MRRGRSVVGAVHPRGGRQSPEVSRVPRCGQVSTIPPSLTMRQTVLCKCALAVQIAFLFILHYFSQHQGHIHTKKHLSKMAGACRPSLNRDSEEHEQRPWDDLLFDYTQGRQTSMKKALLTAASGPIATANADVTAAAVMVAEAVKKAAASTAAVAAPPTELASPVTTMALVPARPLAQQMAVVPARQVAVVPARPLAQQVSVVPARRVLLRSRSRTRSRRRSRTRSRSRRRSPSTSSMPRRRRKRRQRRQRRKSTTSSSSSSSSSSRCSRRQQRTRRRKNRCSVP